MKKLELFVDGMRIFLTDDLRIDFDELPDTIERGKFYKFKIEGCYNIYPLGKVINLFEADSNDALAAVRVTGQSHEMLGGRVHTSGEYQVSNVSGGSRQIR